MSDIEFSKRMAVNRVVASHTWMKEDKPSILGDPYDVISYPKFSFSIVIFKTT